MRQLLFIFLSVSAIANFISFQIYFISQTSQPYGLSPECFRLWTANVVVPEKRLPQITHKQGFSPECVLLCFMRLPKKTKQIQKKNQSNFKGE
jgi:hypothetical protein